MKNAKLPSGQRIDAALLRRWPLPAVPGDLGKEGRGRVLVVGGSREVPGGVLLAAEAALRAGAGKLQIATALSVAPWLAVSVPEARVIGLAEDKRGELARGSCKVIRSECGRCDALVVGPGMLQSPAAEGLLRECVRGECNSALVVDGAALDVFRGRRRLPGPHASGVVITPHAGEMARLWQIDRDEVLERPSELAREVARALDVVVVLKGPTTYIATPDGRSLHNTAGNMGLGTSGSGDVLAGILGGLCARGADPFQAAAWAVFAHAHAGEALARRVAPLGFLARELLGQVPAVLHKLSARRGRTREPR